MESHVLCHAWRAQQPGAICPSPRFEGRPICPPASGSARAAICFAPDKGPSGEGFARPHRRGFVLRNRRRAADALRRRTQARSTIVAGRKDAKGIGEATVSFFNLTAAAAPDLLRPAFDEA